MKTTVLSRTPRGDSSFTSQKSSPFIKTRSYTQIKTKDSKSNLEIQNKPLKKHQLPRV